MDVADSPDNPTAKAKLAALTACKSLLGVEPVRAELAGGGRLKSVRVHLPEGTVIATSRGSPQRAELEAMVLRALKEVGAPVPSVLAFDGTWLIQEDLGTRRLSQLLRDADDTECARLLELALESLAGIHAAGTAADLQSRLYTIGAKPGWLEQLIEMPARLGESLGAPAPALPQSELVALLTGPNRSFIKWDAWPANACVTADGGVARFDWEHCGRRNRLDDLAWVLCDERVPDRPETEERLIAHHLPSFDEDGYRQGAANYLSAFGTFHSCIRLSILLGSWLKRRGEPGAPPIGASRLKDSQVLLRRAARWSGHNDATAALAPWFDRLIPHLERFRTG